MIPLTPEQAEARLAAYRGSKSTSRAVVEFTRDAVRDALHAAPEPLTKTWISYSTSTVGLLAARCEQQGLPLERAVVLNRARIDRFISHDCKDMHKQARASYRSRLDVVAGALLFGQNESVWPRTTLSAHDATEPWTDEHAARVWLWATGSRPESRRERLRACLALGLGAGLRRRDLVLVAARHVSQDGHGVRVAAPATWHDPGRTVTVAAAWEQEVLRAASRAGDGLLLAPDRAVLTPDALGNTLDRANRLATPGDEYSPVRARNTWIVRHLAAGVPLKVLMEQAGLTTTFVFEDLLRYVPATGPDAAAKFMRGV